MTSDQNSPWQGTGQAQDSSKAQNAVDSVKGPAADVQNTAVEKGRDVVDTAKSEAGELVHEAKTQGRRLFNDSVGELRTQADSVQNRIADAVQSLTDELGSMASASDANGPVADLVRSGQQYGDRAASWLRDNDVDQALSGVRRYAARNPWTFMAVAAGAGLLVGRLARGLRDASTDDDRRTGFYDRGSYDRGTYSSDREVGLYGDGERYNAPGGPQLSQGQGYVVADTLHGAGGAESYDGHPGGSDPAFGTVTGSDDPYAVPEPRYPRPGEETLGRDQEWGQR